MQQLPQNNQCKKCHERFSAVHVCAADVKAALAKCCDYCDDGDGICVFPYYGPAPHTHDMSAGWIGSTRTLPKDQWGDNFREDAECEGHGVYMRCPKCGRGEPMRFNAIVSGLPHKGD